MHDQWDTLPPEWFIQQLSKVPPKWPLNPASPPKVKQGDEEKWQKLKAREAAYYGRLLEQLAARTSDPDRVREFLFRKQVNDITNDQQRMNQIMNTHRNRYATPMRMSHQMPQQRPLPRMDLSGQNHLLGQMARRLPPYPPQPRQNFGNHVLPRPSPSGPDPRGIPSIPYMTGARG